MEDLEDSFDLSFHNQWDANIGNKSFPLYDYFVVASGAFCRFVM